MKNIELLSDLLARSSSLHRHLCPRQILGVRMGLLAGSRLSLELPRHDKRLLTFVETDGCAADGVSVATGCSVGGRTLRVVDFGKIAATFVDVETGKAVRIVPRQGIRQVAQDLVPDARSRWHAQLEGYQLLSESDLLTVQRVELTISLEKLVSRAGYRVTCEACAEEIINERQITHEGTVLCRACAGQGYYRLLGTATTQILWQRWGGELDTLRSKLANP